MPETALAPLPPDPSRPSPPRPLGLRALRDTARQQARTAGAWAAQMPADPVQRTALRVAGTELYDVWLLRWPPGTSVGPHDHGTSAGAFCVVAGELSEVRWYGGMTRARSVRPGTVVTIDTGVVHDVIGGPEVSLSVHVYSPPLTSMEFYGDPGDPVQAVVDAGNLARLAPPQVGVGRVGVGPAGQG